MQSKTVLVIDDDPDDMEILSIALRKEGHTVITASDGAEGVRLAIREKPDIIITDILMPNQDGLTTFEQLQDHPDLRSIPVIVCTSAGEKLGFSFSEDDMRTYYGKKPAAFLSKPVSTTLLHEAVRRCGA